jgi:drug/metabolite transporter (DMT)-like permease
LPACVLLALASALAFAVATVAQQRAAARASDHEARSPRFVGTLLRSPQWWGGTLGNGGGYVLQAVALAFGPLVVVSPILVTTLLFALPLGARLSGRRLTRRAWTWAAVLGGSLALFVTLGHPQRGRTDASAAGWLIVAAGAVLVVGTAVVLAHPRSGTARACLLAVAVGVLAGVTALLTKSVVATVPNGLAAVLGAGEIYGLIVVGLAGVYLQQLAFQAGELQASLPVIAVLEPVVAACLGVVLLHETLQLTDVSAAVLVLVIPAMAAATVGLARSEGRALAMASSFPGGR